MKSDPSKVVKPAVKRKPPAAGKGRKAGTPNKTTAAVKDMILTALSNAGGAKYLERCANDHKTAVAFLNLVGKVLPMQITGQDGGALEAKLTVEYVRPNPSA